MLLPADSVVSVLTHQPPEHVAIHTRDIGISRHCARARASERAAKPAISVRALRRRGYEGDKITDARGSERMTRLWRHVGRVSTLQLDDTKRAMAALAQ